MKEIYSKILEDVTSKLPQPVTCKPQDSIKVVRDLMVDNDIGSVIVVDDEKHPVGIVTERDLLTKILGQDISIESVPVSDYMTPDPQTLSISKPVSSALVNMRVGKFRHLAITDKNNVLVKVFSIKDALNFLNDEISERMSEILTP